MLSSVRRSSSFDLAISAFPSTCGVVEASASSELLTMRIRSTIASAAAFIGGYAGQVNVAERDAWASTAAPDNLF